MTRNFSAKHLFESYMKNHTLFRFALLAWLLVGCSKHSQDSTPLVEFTPDPSLTVVAPPIPAPAGRSVADVPAGSIQFDNIGISPALTIYAALADAQLVIEPQIQSLPVTITFSNRQDLARTDAVRLLEEAFHKQAGLVFEHRDARKIAVRQGKVSEPK